MVKLLRTDTTLDLSQKARVVRIQDVERGFIYVWQPTHGPGSRGHVRGTAAISKFGAVLLAPVTGLWGLQRFCGIRYRDYNKIRQPSIFLKSSCPFPPTFAVSCVSSVGPPRGFGAPTPGLRARPKPALGLDVAVRGTNNPPALVGAVAGWDRVEPSSDISRLIPLNTIGRNSSLPAS